MSIDKIKSRNYNLDIKNPHQEEDDLGDPLHLLSHYQERLRLIAEQRDALKDELATALLR